MKEGVSEQYLVNREKISHLITVLTDNSEEKVNWFNILINIFYLLPIANHDLAYFWWVIADALPELQEQAIPLVNPQHKEFIEKDRSKWSS